MVARLSWAWAALLSWGCASVPSDYEALDGDQLWIKTVHLPESEPWYTHFADHTWFELHLDGDWLRVEVLNPNSGVVIEPIDTSAVFEARRWGRRVQVLKRQSGPEVTELAERLLERAPHYPYADAYRAYPGPNSNTFAVWLGRQVPGLAFQPLSTAIGKDYTPGLRWGVTPSGTGLELETSWLGIELGLQEGVTLQLAGLTLGLGLWPLEIELPFLRGFPGSDAGPRRHPQVTGAELPQ